MIEFRALGGAALTDNGRDLPEIPSQPTRLALLLLLAVAFPGYLSRDAILAMLWPEHDSERARRGLRNALYSLRRALGSEAIQSRGDEAVALNSAIIWCDVTRFADALAQKRYADALALYRGDLLSGYHLSEAPEFEHWLDEERARLKRMACEAAWSLAEAEAVKPDFRAALRWAQRGYELGPLDEDAARRLMSLYHRAGDRAGAIAAYEQFTRRLKTELELDPSPETERLNHAIRSATSGSLSPGRRPEPSPSAAAPASPPGAIPPPGNAPHRRWSLVFAVGVVLALMGLWRPWRSAPPTSEAAAGRFAIMPFTVRGSDRLAYLSEGMLDLLTTKLDGIDGLKAVDPHALLAFRASNGDGSGASTIELGRAAAERFGAGYFVLGDLLVIGARLQVRATLYNAQGEAESVATGEAQGESGLFDLVDNLVRQIVAARHPGTDERLTRLVALTTDSLEALKAYLEGERHLRAGRFTDAMGAFGRAIAKDSTFALAHYRFSMAADWYGVTLGDSIVMRAIRFSGRLSPYDRLILNAYMHYHRRDGIEAERLYRRALNIHPDDVDAWHELGETIFHLGPLQGIPFTESRAAFEKTLELEPDHASALLHLARIAIAQDSMAEFRGLAARALAVDSAEMRRVEMRSMLAFASGDAAAQRDLIASLAAHPDNQISAPAWRLSAYLGDLAGARRMLAVLTGPDRTVGGRKSGEMWNMGLSLAQGRVAEAVQLFRTRSVLAPDRQVVSRVLFLTAPVVSPPRELLDSALADVRAYDWRFSPGYPDTTVRQAIRVLMTGLLQLGLRDTAGSVTSEAELRALSTAQTGFPLRLAELLAARREIGEKKYASALARLTSHDGDSASTRALGAPNYPAEYERIVRAEALLALGREGEALQWFVSIMDGTWDGIILAGPAHYRVVELSAALHHPEEAKRYARRLERMWSDPDPWLRSLVARASSLAK
jgi:serine/threonine-protein kinase